MDSESWRITNGPVEIPPGDVDSTLYRYDIVKGHETRSIVVAISNTLMASSGAAVVAPLDTVVATRGEAAVRDTIRYDRVPPERITVTTAGIFEEAADR